MRPLTVTAITALLLASAGAAGQGGDTLSGAALVEALRGGGLTLYFRHAQTDWTRHDQVRQAGDWSSCDAARIRQLSDEGRATARAVGQALRALAIPVTRVLASPYCRTVQTAELLGVGPVQTTTDVMNLRVAEYFGGREAIVRAARALLATPPPAGGNTVIAAHGNLAREATGEYPGEAEGLVLRPDGRGGFEVIARVPPALWDRLAEGHAAESIRRDEAVR